MRKSVLMCAEDIQWLRDVHVHNLPADIRFAILYGNEDAPERIEAWKSRRPDHDEAPDFVWPAA